MVEVVNDNQLANSLSTWNSRCIRLLYVHGEDGVRQTRTRVYFENTSTKTWS